MQQHRQIRLFERVCRLVDCLDLSVVVIGTVTEPACFENSSRLPAPRYSSAIKNVQPFVNTRCTRYVFRLSHKQFLGLHGETGLSDAASFKYPNYRLADYRSGFLAIQHDAIPNILVQVVTLYTRNRSNACAELHFSFIYAGTRWQIRLIRHQLEALRFVTRNLTRKPLISLAYPKVSKCKQEQHCGAFKTDRAYSHNDPNTTTKEAALLSFSTIIARLLPSTGKASWGRYAKYISEARFSCKVSWITWKEYFYCPKEYFHELTGTNKRLVLRRCHVLFFLRKLNLSWCSCGSRAFTSSNFK